MIFSGLFKCDSQLNPALIVGAGTVQGQTRGIQGRCRETVQGQTRGIQGQTRGIRGIQGQSSGVVDCD
jgi:hypothetical protein